MLRILLVLAVLGTILLAGCGPDPGRCALGARGWPLCGI